MIIVAETELKQKQQGIDHTACMGGGREGFAAPVVVRPHVPEEVEGKLAGLLLAVQLIALLSLS